MNDLNNTKDLLCKIRKELSNKFDTIENYTKNSSVKINHIMIIDDDDTSNYVTRKTLECYDIVENITVYDEPLKALEYLKDKNKVQPDLILLDIKMPVMNGFEFIEEFKQINTHTNIIILSSSVYSKDKDKAKSNDIEYMVKPLKVNTLQKFI